MDIATHLDRTEQKLSRRKGLLDYEIEPGIKLPGRRAKFKATIRFFDGSLLHFSETVETGKCYPEYLAYSYQYMRDGVQVFRYDNSPDHPGFVEHKHVGVGVCRKVIPARHPDPDDVIDEIVQFMLAAFTP